MKVVEFENTQGITLKYTTATVFERMVSYMIDVIIMVILSWIAYGIFGSIYSELVLYVFVLPLILFYSLFMELFNNGQSIGKMITGTKIVRVDGRFPTGYDFLMRWVFRWVDIYLTSGMLAIVSISASPRSQRIGDMLADTTVIKTKNLRISLHRILQSASLANYTPVYPQVIQFSEDQIVFAKSVLDRAMKYKNTAHNQALTDLVERLTTLMDIKKPRDNQAFVKTLIKDYVALTR